MTVKKSVIILLIICFFPIMAFGAGKIPVMVSIIPQKYFVSQIGGDLVKVEEMVQPGASPATYEPKPRQMVAVSRAMLYFSIGVPFENAWLGKIAAANPKMKVVHTDRDIKKIAMSAHHHHGKKEHTKPHNHHHHEKGGPSPGHHHKDGHKHRHQVGLDPHIWLSPPLVKIQARTIMEALVDIDPAHQETYKSNYKRFAEELDGLDSELKKTFTGKEGLAFMVFHPAWGYFANAYGLHQIPIEIEGKNPKPAVVKELIKQAKQLDIKVIFVQPQFSSKSATLIANEIKGEVVFANPLAENWISNIRIMADKFKSALK